MDDTEIWLPIPTVPHYEVSSRGRVRSDGTRPSARWPKGHVLAPQLNRFGYYHVCPVYDGGRRGLRQIHTLVAEAFIGPRPSPIHQVDHLDGNRLNNRVENLEWVTRSENVRRAYARNGVAAKAGEKNGRAKITAEDVAVIRQRFADGDSRAAIARDYPLDWSNIDAIVKFRSWKHS